VSRLCAFGSAPRGNENRRDPPPPCSMCPLFRAVFCRFISMSPPDFASGQSVNTLTRSPSPSPLLRVLASLSLSLPPLSHSLSSNLRGVPANYRERILLRHLARKTHRSRTRALKARCRVHLHANAAGGGGRKSGPRRSKWNLTNGTSTSDNSERS